MTCASDNIGVTVQQHRIPPTSLPRAQNDVRKPSSKHSQPNESKTKHTHHQRLHILPTSFRIRQRHGKDQELYHNQQQPQRKRKLHFTGNLTLLYVTRTTSPPLVQSNREDPLSWCVCVVTQQFASRRAFGIPDRL